LFTTERNRTSIGIVLTATGLILATTSVSISSGETNLERDDSGIKTEVVSFVRQSRCAGAVSFSGGGASVSGGIGIMSGRLIGKPSIDGNLSGQGTNSTLLSPSIAVNLLRDYLWGGIDIDANLASLDFSGDGVIDILDLSICIERLTSPVTTTRKGDQEKKPGSSNPTSDRGGTLENE
jgi:hypothetical protein